MNQEITTTPTALAGTTDEVWYTVQNQTNRVMYLEIASSAPTNTENAFRLEANGETSYGRAKHASGDSIFVWSPMGGGSIVYDEAE